MNYKNYKIHHSRGKSDTNFYKEQMLLNGAYSGLKVLRVSIVSDLALSSFNQKKMRGRLRSKSKKEKREIISKDSNTTVISNSSIDSNIDYSVGERILTLVERVLLFKQELDYYFFHKKIRLLKFHLNNISAIIIKNISDLQNELIKECPILKNSHIAKILGNFSDIISTFMETKPQDLYREIKDAILNQWEKNRMKIKELFEKIEQNCNISGESEKNEMSFSLEINELYYGLNESMRRDSITNNNSFMDKSNKKISEEEENIKRLKRVEPSTLFYLVKKKKEIINFVSSVTQYILFSISRLYYDMDYYSIIISSLQFKIFYAIMYYVDSKKDKIEYLTEVEKKEQRKVFHLINHFIHLLLSFNKSIQTGKISLDNGSLNSLSKYILNNFIEITSKCQGLKMPKNISEFKEPTLSQIKYKTKFYKNYLQRYKKYKDNSLLRIFMLYYNSKMTFWKSIMVVAKPKDDNKNFICRTCEKEIPLEDIFLHLGCCKEQQSFYDKMNTFKIKIQNYITQLDIYLAKSNINTIPTNKKLFGKGGCLFNIISRIPGCENDEDGKIFIKKLIQIYTYEKNKPSDYYEKRPEDISYIVSMSYFTLMIFLLNKLSIETEKDLSEILGGIFCILLQIFMNVQFILYVKKSQTKNTMIKNKRKNLIDSLEQPKESKNDNNIIIFNDNQNKSKINNSKKENNSDDDEFFNPELNFKTTIQNYKLKLSLNSMMFLNNTFNDPKAKKKDRIRFRSPNVNNSKVSSINKIKNLNNISFFKKKSNSIINIKDEKQNNIGPASSTKATEIFSNFNSNNLSNNNDNIKSNNNNNKCIQKSKSSENFSATKLDLNTKNFFKLNTCNYRTIGMRSLKMTRNNSTGNLLSENKKGKYNKKYNIFGKDKDKSNTSIVLDMNNSQSGTNIINTSMISEIESSGEIENVNKTNISKIDSNQNLSRVGSYLSRIDSDVHRLDSNISRIDSIENNKIDDENNQNKNNFILNSNQNFQLGYRGDQSKKNLNKLSLFKKLPEEKINVSEKKKTSFKKNKDEKEINIDIESDRESSELDANSSDSSDEGQNILINEEEEEINENKNEDDINNNKKRKENKEKKEDNNNYFFLKNIEDDEFNNKDINNEYEKFISPNESYSDSCESDNENIFNENRLKKKDFEEILPNMIYIKPGSQNNINYEHIAYLFNELMEKIHEKSDVNLHKDNKFNIITKDQEFNLNKNKSDLNNICPNDLGKINVSSIKSNNLDDNNIDELNTIKDIDKKESQIKISKFKLILPIAKGGYGSVGLYKNMATSDTYAIKTVDINTMREKKLSSSLKNEQNILREINNDYVVNSYFIFQDKKNYYFVMEYLPGGDVYTLLSKNNLPKKTIQLIVAETILAVNYLHSIGIIHHDIKPENILISLKGHFKLSDFGLSKTLQEDSKFEDAKNMKNFVEFNKFPLHFNLGEDEDETKDAVGTLNYMAPELFTDKYPHGGGIDYWAIGVLIFDLYSYSLPFEAQTQEEMRKNIIEINIDWSKLINDEVKKIYGNIEPAVDLIKKFLKEDPDERLGDKNLDEIKNHKFFEGFNWENVQTIKNESMKEYVKQRVKENNNKIKQLALKNKLKKGKGHENNENKNDDGYPNIIEMNLTENEEKYLFTERYDNLNKKNNELIKRKIDKEINFKENISELMLLDLE